MKHLYPVFIVCLLLSVSCKQAASQSTGDLQYFELRGNVARLDDEWLFPDHAISFDESGHIVLPVEPEIVKEYSDDDYYPKDASYPLTIYSWNDEENFESPGVYLLYDSKMHLLKIGVGFTIREIQYDKTGRIQSVSFEDEGDEGITRFEYDASGNRIEEETIGEYFYEKMKYDQYEFDSHGNWISRRWVQVDQDGSVVAEGRHNRKGKILYW